jgi:hypothetical protein
VPPDRQRETRRPDLFEWRPCPVFKHTTELTPLAPHGPAG